MITAAVGLLAGRTVDLDCGLWTSKDNAELVYSVRSTLLYLASALCLLLSFRRESCR